MDTTASSIVNFFSTKLSKLTSPEQVTHDKELADYKADLDELYGDLKSIYFSYKKFCESTLTAASKSMDLFKGSLDNTYRVCTESIATEGIKTFYIDKDNESGNYILNELKKWMISIKSLIHKINEAQEIHNIVHQNNEQLQVLLSKQQRTQNQRQQHHENVVSEQNHNILSEIGDIINEKSEERLSNSINEKLSLIWALNDNMIKLKNEISVSYKKQMDNKYDKFDFIYDQISEMQQYWFNFCDQQFKKYHDIIKQNKINNHTQDLLNMDDEEKKEEKENEEEEEQQQPQYENMIDIEVIDEPQEPPPKPHDLLGINHLFDDKDDQQQSDANEDKKEDKKENGNDNENGLKMMDIKNEDLMNVTFEKVISKYTFDHDNDDNNNNDEELLCVNYCVAKCETPKILQSMDCVEEKNNDKAENMEYYIKLGLHCNINLNQRSNITNIVVALDVSKSMNDLNRLKIATNTINSIFLELNNFDKFGFVTFCSSKIWIHFELENKDIINYNDNNKFMENYINHAQIVNGYGDKNMNNGFRNAIELFFNDDNNDNNNHIHKRIIYITDSSPNIELLQMIINAQTEHNIFTSYLEIGGDKRDKNKNDKLKQQNILKFSNYFNGFYYLNNAKLLQTQFKYMINPILFDLNISLKSTRSTDICVFDKIYGKLSHINDNKTENENNNELKIIDVSTIFASEFIDEHQMILIKLKSDDNLSILCKNLCLEISYKDINNQQFDDNKYITTTNIINDNNSLKTYYENNNVRKAILLLHYIQFIKKWRNDNTDNKDNKGIHEFIDYFKSEKDIINDKKLNDCVEELNVFANNNENNHNDYNLPSNIKDALNKWADTNDINILLKSLNDVLPKELKNKLIINDDNDLNKCYKDALKLLHPDRSISRNDDIITKEICKFLFYTLSSIPNND